MKKIAFIVFILVLAPLSVFGEAFDINNFHSEITIQSDGKVLVKETIEVTFDYPRHGIYRDIPIAYTSADGDMYTELDVQSVTDGSKSIPYVVSDNGYNVRIRIGDENKTVSDNQKYVITYIVTGVILPFEEYDEFYWNVTGDRWETSIEKSSATVNLPEERFVQMACYYGYYGAAERCLSKEVGPGKIEFSNSNELSPGQGLSVAVAFTKGMVPILKVDPPKTILDLFFSASGIISLLVVLIVGGFLIYRMWWTRGRDMYLERKNLHDPDSREKIMPIGEHESIGAEYDPPSGLRPAEIGVLMDEKADTLDVSSTIVDLAVRGHITIKEIPKKWLLGSTDYELVKTEKDQAGLMEYEKKLLHELFVSADKVKLSELKNKFYAKLKEVKDKLYEEVVRKKLFDRNPDSVRVKYLLIGIGITAVSIFLTFISVTNIESSVLAGGLLGLSICGVAFIVISFFMPKKTALGRELYRKARGYKLFVSGTEKYRQPFFEKQNVFMDVLPYAIVFGTTKKLANAMDEMGIKPAQPIWYSGAAAFNTHTFVSNIDSFSSSLSTAIASAPSGSGSGGGGFSGGGFGGGGGGSW